MRSFDYTKYKTCLWDNEILNYLSQIHEYKGRQELFLTQKPADVERLIDFAKVESIESSNRIEGIVTTATRIRQLAKEKTLPRNRDESEIAGYRDVLNTVHENYEYIELKSSIILQLHRDLMKYAGTGNGGKYKSTQNYIKATKADGTEVIRFTPVPLCQTESCINELCDSFNVMIGDGSVDPLILIPVFIHDFLCIHPFNDGNGRMSRLLTLLLLYRSGYPIGRYISIEKHIEKTKEAYYNALGAASEGWHEEEDDPVVFVKYMLGVILACYREFDGLTRIITYTKVISESAKRNRTVTVRNKAYDIVKASVDSRIGKFTKREIVSICPSIGEKSVEASLKQLLDEGYISKHGSGKGTFYSKCPSNTIT